MVTQLPLFDAPPPRPADTPPSQPQSPFDWPTIDRCSEVARAQGRRLYMDPFDNYSLYGPTADDHEHHHGLDALCAALGIHRHIASK